MDDSHDHHVVPHSMDFGLRSRNLPSTSNSARRGFPNGSRHSKKPARLTLGLGRDALNSSISPNLIALSAMSATRSKKVQPQRAPRSRMRTCLPRRRCGTIKRERPSIQPISNFLNLRNGLVVSYPVSEVKEAGATIGEAVVRSIDRLPTYAEAISTIAAKGGAHGVRATLKEIAWSLRTEIAEAIGAIAAAAEPATIEPSKN